MGVHIGRSMPDRQTSRKFKELVNFSGRSMCVLQNLANRTNQQTTNQSETKFKEKICIHDILRIVTENKPQIRKSWEPGLSGCMRYNAKAG